MLTKTMRDHPNEFVHGNASVNDWRAMRKL